MDALIKNMHIGSKILINLVKSKVSATQIQQGYKPPTYRL